jgi:hypothetical protein
MSSKFAVGGNPQSGQRFLEGSVPRLIRHAARCETAGGGVGPLPAGKDQNRSREFEGGALIGREAPVPSSLDSITNNRHSVQDCYTVPDCYQRPSGRGRNCGRFSIRGTDPKTGRTHFRRVNCGLWTCSYCGKRKVRLTKRRIRDEAGKFNLRYFWTLTLAPPFPTDPEARVRRIRCSFNKLREYLKRKYGIAPTFICILEFTQRGNPHLHVLIDRYIEHTWVSNTWDRLGGGKIVWAKRITIRNVVHYLSKYLTKDLLLSAPKGARRITSSRTIRLFPKFKPEFAWEFVRESIWDILAAQNSERYALQRDLFRFRQLDLFRFIPKKFDEEGYLTAFAVVSDA